MAPRAGGSEPCSVEADGTGDATLTGEGDQHVINTGVTAAQRDLNINSPRSQELRVEISAVAVVALLAFASPVGVLVLFQDLVRLHPLVTVLGVGTYWMLLVMLVATAHMFQLLGPVLERKISTYGWRYRQWLRSSISHVQRRGLLGDFTPELGEVFVDVSLVAQAPHAASPSVLGAASPRTNERTPIWDHLRLPKPIGLAVLGVPGGGKSTLVGHIAWRLTRRYRGRRYFPILLELKDHVHRLSMADAPDLPGLVREVVPTLRTAEPVRWWESVLDRGRAVVLLDGLDEVVLPRDRKAVTDWLKAEALRFHLTTFVVTSRPHGHPEDVSTFKQFVQLRLFTDPQVNTFVHRWYLTVERRRQQGSDRDARRRARHRADDLLRRIRDAPALHDLAVNPLLLTIIANVHLYRGSLPESRAALYAELCKEVLQPRGHEKRRGEQLTAGDTQRVLMVVAHELMCRHTTVMAEDLIIAAVREPLERCSSAVEPGPFLIEATRSGLLVQRDARQYAFAHLTFQEYLAARYLSESGVDTGSLRRYVDDPWWREVMLLYAADRDAGAVVRACLDSGSAPALALAYLCLERDREASSEPRHQLDQIVAAAFLPNADSVHRARVAAVLALRHVHESVSTSLGSRVCPRPVTTGLYSLFRKESVAAGAGPPGPPNPDSSRPVQGIWGEDALDFVVWINRVVADTADVLYRLVTTDELDELARRDGSVGELFRSQGTSIWTQPDRAGAAPGLWTGGGGVSPLQVERREIVDHVAADAATTPVLEQLVVRVIRVRVMVLGDALHATQSRAQRISGILRGGLHASLRFYEDNLRELQAQRDGQDQSGDTSEVAADQSRFEYRLEGARELVNVWKRVIRRADDPDFDIQRAFERAGESMPRRSPDPAIDFEREAEFETARARSAVLAIARAVTQVRLLDQVLSELRAGVNRSFGDLAATLRVDAALDQVHRRCAALFDLLDPDEYRSASTNIKAEREVGPRLRRLSHDTIKVADQIAASAIRLAAEVRQLIVDDDPPLVGWTRSRPPTASATTVDADPLEQVAAQLRHDVGRGFADAVCETLRQQRSADRSHLASLFAGALVAAARPTAQTVTLDPLGKIAASACDDVGRSEFGAWAGAAAKRLRPITRQIFNRSKQIEPSTAAVIRLLALALAAEADDHRAAALGQQFRAITAASVVLEDRASGQRRSPETIVLAHS